MTQNFTMHSHTTFSDGKSSLSEMVEQAKKIGFSKIGISDHLIIHKNIDKSPSWEMMSSKPDAHIYKKDFKSALPEFQKHCDELRNFSEKAKFKILIGFEVDFFTYDGWLDEMKEFLSHLDYDYLISGNHFLFADNCEIIYNIHKNIADFADNEQIKNLVSNHFKTIKKSAESGLFKFVAHIDYVRKMGNQYCQPHDFASEKAALIKSLKENNTGTEISTKGLRKIGDYYPAPEILRQIAAEGVKVIISDDAHRTTELGYDFDKAEQELQKYGIINMITE